MTRPTSARSASVLGLFPSLYPDGKGGIQLAGRLAWNTVEQLTRTRQLLTYAPSDATLTSRARAHGRFAVEAARAATHSDIVLVWHLALLRSLLLSRAAGAILLFLH